MIVSAVLLTLSPCSIIIKREVSSLASFTDNPFTNIFPSLSWPTLRLFSIVKFLLSFPILNFLLFESLSGLSLENNTSFFLSISNKSVI